ncbi:hypothetical protein ACHAWO_005286 [Cyclotella atomus]|uniref:F-box domain-containing protein n=1 Tax=Cyclotella atomus TaxID=382360 RepID=A0ABD3P552_9STRA
MWCSDRMKTSPLADRNFWNFIPISMANGEAFNNGEEHQMADSLAAEMATSYESASSIFRSSPSSTPSRPTKEEATALWEIMPTSSLINSPLPVSESSSRVERTKANKACPLVSPIGSPPNEFISMFSIPKIKSGPPYESTLPYRASSSTSNVKAYPLTPRASTFGFSPSDCSGQDPIAECIHYGLGPHLGILPESIIYAIVGYIDYTERHPTLMLVSRGMTSILTRPEFLLELKHAHKATSQSKSLLSQAFEVEDPISNELLLVVGGKCPIKASDADNRLSPRITQVDERVHRRMTMLSNDYKGILGYDMKRSKWLRFGGDPLVPLRHETEPRRSLGFGSSIPRNNLHPLSPMNITDAKPIYVGHPLYSVMFFGGTHYETGQPSNRVIAFSFLTAKWELWPEMMRSRHGADIILGRVESNNIGSKYNNVQPNDSIVLIGCDLDLCDCYRCNPPATTTVESNADMMNFDLELPSGRREERREPHADAIGKCEVLDLITRTWSRRESKAPSCPPDDGGVAVLGGRWVFLPGTCPPPPSTAASMQTNVDEEVIVTPLAGSETSSQADLTHANETEGMETENNSDDEVIESSLGKIFRSLHYRPGLVYDSWLDIWYTLPSRPYVTTSSPTTFAFNNRVLVLGGYRSSSENALSCYRHREEDAILDYEDHLDYAWWYTPESLGGQLKSDEDIRSSYSNEHRGNWTFGGGNSRISHRQDFASSSDMAHAVAASMSLHFSSSCPDRHNEFIHSNNSIDESGFPFGAPVSVRGATMTTYQGRMTMLGGLSTFSRTFYDTERKTIWQFYPEICEWKRASMELPTPALLDGYSFSMHI